MRKNDADYLQMLISDADSSNVILIPRKKYYIDKTLNIPSNRTIDFNKATIIRKGKIFNMVQNQDTLKGNENINIYNLELIGVSDTLDAVNSKHRFSGINFVKVINVKLNEVIVKETINNENGAGIYFKSCKNVTCEGIHGFNNDRTAILLDGCDKVIINGSTTAFNKGSGITIVDSKNSILKNIITHDNGYSNLSVNSKNSIIENVVSYNSSFSGVNIGHIGERTKSDSSTFFNIVSHSNKYEGITIANSLFITIDSAEVHGNYRNNIRVFLESNSINMSRVHSHNSRGGQGLLIEDGEDHYLENSNFFDNKNSGIYIQKDAKVHISTGVNCFGNNISNNESAEIIIDNASDCIIEISEKVITNLENYVWISGGKNNIIYTRSENPKIRQTKQATFKVLEYK